MLCAIVAVARKLASGTSRKSKHDHHSAVAAEEGECQLGSQTGGPYRNC
jgi:hypothetical protein